MDGPEHPRTRRHVIAAFTPNAVGRLEPAIVEHADAVVAGVLAREHFDAVTDLAAEVPLLVLADVLGVPRCDRKLLFEWSNNLVGFDDPEYGAGDVRRVQRTFTEAFAYANALARERRRSPRADVMTMLATGEVDGERLSPLAFAQLWLLLVVAGNETTRHLVSGAIDALLDHPGEIRRLVAAPDLVPTAVEELLRWITPIMQFRRTATADVDLHGAPVRDGDKVVVYYIAANRDPRVFALPHALDVGRQPNTHLAFGVGPHFCLGAHLARAEATAILRRLLPHLSGLERAGAATRLESNFMNGLKALPVRWTSGRSPVQR